MADTKRTASGRGPGRHGHGGHGFQRPKDMKGTFKKLMRYRLSAFFSCLLCR